MNKREFLKFSAVAGMTGLGSIAKADSGKKQFRVPPEESKHQATLMQWPTSRTVYRQADFRQFVQNTIARIANAISDFEPVIMMVAKSEHARVNKLLSERVTLWDIATDDLWCRDSGPLFAKTADDNMVVSQIQFNGWGNKQSSPNDMNIAAKVAQRLDLPIIASDLYGEPGGVEHDGNGLLMAHESSWVVRNRNPGMSRQDIETRLLTAYGAQHMIWSKGVRGQDITDYHIDSLARFTGPARVLIMLPDQPDRFDPFHRAALKTHDDLVNAGLHVDVIPEPVKTRNKSSSFVASYVNYYACNGAVIAGHYGDIETDAIAKQALARHFPGRQIIMLNVDALGELGGGIHCATQQIPV